MKNSPWRYYINQYRPDWRPWLVSLLLSVLQALAVIPLIGLVRYAFDVALPSGDIQLLLLVGVAILLIKLTLSALIIFIRRINVELVSRVSIRIRTDLLLRIYAFPRSFHSQAELGKLHAILEQDSDRVDGMTDVIGAQLIPALTITIGFVIALLVLNPLLFGTLLIVSPIIVIAASRLKIRLAAANTAYRQSSLTYSQGLHDILQRMELTRLQTAEEQEIAVRSEELSALRRTSAWRGWLNTAYVETQSSLIALAIVIILIVGGVAVATDAMTLGSLVAFYVVVGFMADYLRQIWSSIPLITAGAESLHALFELLDYREEHAYHGSHRLSSFSGKIEMGDVSFAYAHSPVLQDVSFTLQPETISALIGPNGAGKSTIIWLLLGLYRPQKGNIAADGVPYDHLDLAWLRKTIGVVPQNPHIFDGAIWENITYGMPTADIAQVERACRLALADEFIGNLKDGYETRVGEHGILLSGGQRQRLALARALLRTPRILILDEPTNHLDRNAVQELMTNIKNTNPQSSILIVTHDSSLLAFADVIYAIEEGRLSRVAEPLPYTNST